MDPRSQTLWFDQVVFSTLQGGRLLSSRLFLEARRRDLTPLDMPSPGILNRMGFLVRDRLQSKLVSLASLNVGMESMVQVSGVSVPAVLDQEVRGRITRHALVSIDFGHGSPL